MQKFITRKCEITNPKTIIFGCIGSGKSQILLDFMANFKKGEFLYINMNDLRYEILDLSNEFDKIFDFLHNNLQISAIFLDNLNQFNTDEISHLQNLISLNSNPNLDTIIISTRKNSLNLEKFTKLKITPLCFEEFIAFDKRITEINAIISAFFMQGGSVKNSFLSPNEIINFEQNTLRQNLSENEILILKECLNFVNLAFSANKIHCNLKEKIRISKDSVYGTIDKFEDENYINLISKFNDEKATKKTLFFEF